MSEKSGLSNKSIHPFALFVPIFAPKSYCWAGMPNLQTNIEILEKNKQFVCEYYDLAINKKDFEKAKKYMGPRYKQHNPLVKDGPEGLHEFIEFLKVNAPRSA